MNNQTTHFGYQVIAKRDKINKVAAVFHSVAPKYNLMNDIMSIGLHRIWKSFAVSKANVKSGFKVLDIAGGTGDLSIAFAKQVGCHGEVWLTDINESMLHVGRDCLFNKGIVIPIVLCNAEKLPFYDNYFDCVLIAFGLRNITHQDVALSEMYRVLKFGGTVLVLEFSKIWKCFEKPYHAYSFYVLPWLGKKIANDVHSYRYLVESIRMHPDQKILKKMMLDACLRQVKYYNLIGGLVALHTGVKC